MKLHDYQSLKRWMDYGWYQRKSTDKMISDNWLK